MLGTERESGIGWMGSITAPGVVGCVFDWVGVGIPWASSLEYKGAAVDLEGERRLISTCGSSGASEGGTLAFGASSSVEVGGWNSSGRTGEEETGYGGVLRVYLRATASCYVFLWWKTRRVSIMVMVEMMRVVRLALVGHFNISGWSGVAYIYGIEPLEQPPLSTTVPFLAVEVVVVKVMTNFAASIIAC
jgi:hypothetical protein